VSAIIQYSGLAASELPALPLHLAVGMFDGLHRGHQAVIEQAVEGAKTEVGVAVVLTFWPHPSVLFRPQDATRLIMTSLVKAHVLSRLGIAALITEPFTPEFAALKAEDFLPTLQRYLPHLSVVYVGENWRFGRGRIGDVGLLKRSADALNLKVVSVPRVRHDEDAISSTRIRTLLETGEIERANQMLGYVYFAEGTVVTGKGLGRKIGFPTLNLNWVPDLRPHFGVYAVKVRKEDGGRALPGVANYGLRPTVEDIRDPRLEVNLLTDCPYGPGDELTVEFHAFLRGEQQFAGVAELEKQIARDRGTAASVLAAIES
jgi:riboflavin kinase / FMN adenylyltransferase